MHTRIGTMNRAAWSTTKPPEGGTLTGREPDNAADHAERPPARVPRLRGKARFMGSVDIQQVDAHCDHELRGRGAFHRVPICWAKSGTEWNRSLPGSWRPAQAVPWESTGENHSN